MKKQNSIRQFHVAIFGLGTVSQGLLELLCARADWLQETYRLQIRISGLLSRSKIFQADGAASSLSPCEALKRLHAGTLETTSEHEVAANKLLAHTLHDAVIELTPTTLAVHPSSAFQTIKAALTAGKHVITANKEPIARHYQELLQTAQTHKRRLLFEATVLSGTPVFNLYQYGLQGSDLIAIKGILNGTTNFILTQMEAGQAYEEALKEAQRCGIAESDPSYDVSGKDTMLKTTILVRTLFHQDIDPSDIPYTGISKLGATAVRKAEQENKRYKLVANIAKDAQTQQVHATVNLELLPLEHPLAQVRQSMNALCLTTRLLDKASQITIIGEGAGKTSAASGVFQDLLTIALAEAHATDSSKPTPETSAPSLVH